MGSTSEKGIIKTAKAFCTFAKYKSAVFTAGVLAASPAMALSLC
jgi:hypothetical protein